MENDIAVVKFSSNLNLNRQVAVLALPRAQNGEWMRLGLKNIEDKKNNFKFAKGIIRVSTVGIF